MYSIPEIMLGQLFIDVGKTQDIVLGPHIIPNINCCWIKDLNIKSSTFRILKEDIGNDLHCSKLMGFSKQNKIAVK